MYLVTIVIAILEGPQEGAIVGFAGGMAQDFMLNTPKGITALTLTLLGYTMGLARQYIVSPSPLLPTMLVAAGTVGRDRVLPGRGRFAGPVRRPVGLRSEGLSAHGAVRSDPHTDPLPPSATHV